MLIDIILLDDDDDDDDDDDEREWLPVLLNIFPNHSQYHWTTFPSSFSSPEITILFFSFSTSFSVL